MGKASQSRPKQTSEGVLKLLEEFKVITDGLQEQVSALWKEGLLHESTRRRQVESLMEQMSTMEKVVELRMEALEAKSATLFTSFEGLFAPLCGRLADVER